MRVFFQIVVVTLAGLGLFYIGALAFVHLTDPDCTSSVVRSVQSPGRRFLAEYEVRTCRSSPNVESYVLLSAGPERARSRWAAFAGPGSMGIGTSGLETPVPLGIEWKSDDELEISFPEGIRPLSSEGIKNGVKVIYREVEL
jgi:hypothetical protein